MNKLPALPFYSGAITMMLGSLLAENARGQQPSQQQKPLRQPNILCIVCEDISPFLKCFGDPVAKTPNLDRLASEGIRYNRMYTPVGVCAPSRAALITGMYPTAIGANHMRNTGMNNQSMPPEIQPYDVVLPEGAKCYTEYLRAAGYYCTNNSKTDYQFAAPLTAWDENGTRAHWKNRPEGMPFFSVFNIITTHESQQWQRANEPLTVDPDSVPLPPYYPDDSIVRRDVARMYSNIHEMDKQVQALISEVVAEGLLDNTIILWYSDNGGPLPRGKREIYETGTRVPMIVRFPDKRNAGKVEDRLCSFVDIPPTLLSLAGIRPPDYMHGQPFLGVYAASPREYVYGGRNRMDEIVDKAGYVRDKRFRYVRNYFPGTPDYMDVAYRKQIPMMAHLLTLYRQGKLNEVQRRWFDYPRPAEEFFDVDNDPYELNDLMEDPAYQKDITRLREAYNSWDGQYNDLWKLPELSSRELFWPGGIQPVTGTPVIAWHDQGIKISCSTPGTSIAYQVKGKGFSTDHWFLYTRPISCKPGDVIAAVAVRAGYKPGPVVTYTDGTGAYVSGNYRNLFLENGHLPHEISAKIDAAFQQLFRGDTAHTVYFKSGKNNNGPLAYLSDVLHHDVRSEGMSYGMMICLQLDKKAEFDALWNWAMTHMYVSAPEHPSEGYFRWSLKTDGTPNSETAAPDGEEYFVMALYFAAARWGNGSGIYNYKAMADMILTAMRHRPLKTGATRFGTRTVSAMFNEETCMIRFVPDQGANHFTDPSYHLPAFYELWARRGPEADRSFWAAAADSSRNFFQKATHPETGLAPDYANFDGTPHPTRRNPNAGHFSYDAWRTAGNWSVDWSWWQKDPREQELSNRILAFFASQGMNTYGAQYTLDGKVLHGRHPAGLVAVNAVASLAATHPLAKDFAEALWDAPIPSAFGERYYDGLLYMMGLLHCSASFRIW
ncbi:MAG TPA: glycosyl hydrolase family 8 [Bacteroidales bacterium]|nr:glycosyl hydrolase family 8 [Bacteroidales bacterium]